MKTMIYTAIIIAVLGFAKHIASEFTATTHHAVTERQQMLENW